MKDKKKVISGIGITLIIITLVIGLSYALWSFNVVQPDMNSITGGCLELELQAETDAINLEKAYPITDEEASSLKPYTFTITNICSGDTSYNLSLEMMETADRLSTDYVAVSVDNGVKKILGSLDETELTYTKGDYTPYEGRLLLKGSLKGQESKTHGIRLWIDESVTIEDDAMDKNFISKVVLNATVKEQISIFADYIIDLADTSEDVVKMEHEVTEQTLALTDYRYVGSNPNNYVCLEDSGKCTEDQLYRIIGVIPTQSSENGEYENRVKLIKATTYGATTAWNSTQVNDWTTSSLKNTLNTTYWDSISEYQKYIDDTKWYLGGYSTSDATTNTFYTAERGTTVYSGRPISVVAKVGLMYSSDYGYAVGGDVRATCLASDLRSYNSNNCYTNDWLFLSGSDQWTISPGSSYATDAFYVISNGSMNGYRVTYAYVGRPVFYLKSNVGILAGDGTLENPYGIKIS